MTFVTRMVPVGALTLAAGLALAGCGGDVESSQAFQEQVSRIDRIDEDLKASKSRLIALDSEFQQVSKDVATLVSNGGVAGAGNPEAVKAIEARMQNIEQSMKALSGNFAGLTKQVAAGPGERLAADIERRAGKDAAEEEVTTDASEADVAAANAPAGGDELGALPKAPQIKARKKDGASEAKPASQRRKAERTEAPKPRGRYHLVKSGETIEQIASRYHSAPSKIQAANGLPKGGRLIAGQEIYVPGS